MRDGAAHEWGIQDGGGKQIPPLRYGMTSKRLEDKFDGGLEDAGAAYSVDVADAAAEG